VTSSTAYALVELRGGSEVLWFGASSLGFHESVSNWARAYAADQIDTGDLAGRVAYDNGPEIAPGGAANALVSVRFTDMTFQGVGERVTVRKDGEVAVTLRYPMEMGDAAVLEKAEAVLLDFQDLTVPVDVRFFSPTVEPGGLQGAYYEATVRAPFYRLHTPDRPTAGSLTLAASWDEIANAIRARFEEYVTDAVPIPTAWDNAPNPTSGGVRWARLAVLSGQRRRIESPPSYRSTGVAIASVFVPAESGDAPGYRVADAIYDAFIGAHDTGVEFGIPNVRTIGRATGEPWWQVNVDCPFTAFHST
jgi:hypothetical protein